MRAYRKSAQPQMSLRSQRGVRRISMPRTGGRRPGLSPRLESHWEPGAGGASPEEAMSDVADVRGLTPI